MVCVDLLNVIMLNVIAPMLVLAFDQKLVVFTMLIKIVFNLQH